MSTVIVIATAHSEFGVCTSKELLKIIEEISPEVVFCEASPKKLPAMIKRTDVSTPEMNVIKKLINKKDIDIIPIDVDEDPFDQRLEAMFDLFKNKMKVYSNATTMMLNCTYSKGFNFLNSVESDRICRDKSSMENYFLDRVKNSELVDFYSRWLKWNDLRENQWINLIQKYFNTNKPRKAVFLVGAGHRFRLMEKLNKNQNSYQNSFDWDFFYFK